MYETILFFSFFFTTTFFCKIGIRIGLNKKNWIAFRIIQAVAKLILFLVRNVWRRKIPTSIINSTRCTFQVLFVIFMVIVAVLLVNLLIAMMGNTYTMIAETKNEWQRQWARIVLVVERGVPPSERLKNFMSYSQPMSDGRRALVLRLNMTVIINSWQILVPRPELACSRDCFTGRR